MIERSKLDDDPDIDSSAIMQIRPYVIIKTAGKRAFFQTCSRYILIAAQIEKCLVF